MLSPKPICRGRRPGTKSIQDASARKTPHHDWCDGVTTVQSSLECLLVHCAKEHVNLAWAHKIPIAPTLPSHRLAQQSLLGTDKAATRYHLWATLMIRVELRDLLAIPSRKPRAKPSRVSVTRGFDDFRQGRALLCRLLVPQRLKAQLFDCRMPEVAQISIKTPEDRIPLSPALATETIGGRD